MQYRPVEETAPLPSKGRTRSTPSPSKKDSVVAKHEKPKEPAVLTPRKSSRQISKIPHQPDSEKTKDVKSSPSNKTTVVSKARTDPSSTTRASRVTGNQSTKKVPPNDIEQTKSTKSSQYKTGRPINPIEFIDELQGIEDFLRESINEPKKPEGKGSPKKSLSASEIKISTPAKDKASGNTPVLKLVASTPEAKSALEKLKAEPEACKSLVQSISKSAAGDGSNAIKTSKSSALKEVIEKKPESESNKGIKRKGECDSEQMTKKKVPKMDVQTEKDEATIVDNNKNISSAENSKTPIPVPVFVVPNEDFSDDSKVTEGKCGNCNNCKRKPCFECSSCKREDFTNCIDVYCLNQRDHRDQRQAMRELYLQAKQQNAQLEDSPKRNSEQSLNEKEEEKASKVVELDTVKKESDKEIEILETIKATKSEGGNVKARFSDQGVIFEIENTESDSDDEELSIEQKIDKVMERIVKSDKLSPEKLQSIKSKVSKTITERYSDKKEVQKERKKNRTDYVYGGSSKAKKVRRCGECEGCTRDDCGKCIGCLDKPKFGGKNTRKQACTMRKCRMK